MNDALLEHLVGAKDEVIRNGTGTSYEIKNKLLGYIFEAIELLKEADCALEIQPEETRKSNYLKTFSVMDCRTFFPEIYIEKLVKGVVGDQDFIYKDDMWRAYKDDCHRRGMQTMERQCLNAALYTYGYQDYYFWGKMSWWRPGKPKPRPGKRARSCGRVGKVSQAIDEVIDDRSVPAYIKKAMGSREPGKKVDRTSLYKEVCSMCKASGQSTPTKNMVYSIARSAGYKELRSNGARYFIS